MPELEIALCKNCRRSISRDPSARRARWIHNDTRSAWCNRRDTAYAEPLDLEEKK